VGSWFQFAGRKPGTTLPDYRRSLSANTEGGRGEFTVWVRSQKVSEKGWIRLPRDEVIVAAVRDALAAKDI